VLPSPALYSPPEKKFEDAPQRTDVKAVEGNALESIKITAPGTYELNLPSLFERDELIMAVKEGTYFIDLTSAFKKGKKG
jgi:predicted  nucleic acid-binding Zn-ribbon protein